jgi:hypothetical protein
LLGPINNRKYEEIAAATRYGQVCIIGYKKEGIKSEYLIYFSSSDDSPPYGLILPIEGFSVVNRGKGVYLDWTDNKV